MNKKIFWIIILAIITCFMSIQGRADSQPTNVQFIADQISKKLPGEWETSLARSNTKNKPRAALIKLTPKGQNINNWKTMFSVIISERKDRNLSKIRTYDLKKLFKFFGSISYKNVIEEKDRLVFEWENDEEHTWNWLEQNDKYFIRMTLETKRINEAKPLGCYLRSLLASVLTIDNLEDSFRPTPQLFTTLPCQRRTR